MIKYLFLNLIRFEFTSNHTDGKMTLTLTCMFFSNSTASYGLWRFIRESGKHSKQNKTGQKGKVIFSVKNKRSEFKLKSPHLPFSWIIDNKTCHI